MSLTLDQKSTESPAETLNEVNSSSFSISQLWEMLNRFFFKPMDPTGIGLLRIIGGILILNVHFAYTFDLLSFVGGDQAWIDNQAIEYFRHEMPIHLPEAGWQLSEEEIIKRQSNPYAHGTYAVSIFFHVNNARTIYFIHGCCLLVMFLFTIGLWTRITGILTWFACVSYIQRNNSLLFGMDTMMMIWLLYMLIAPAGATFSVDRLLEKWSARQKGLPVLEVQPSISANFAMRCLQIHYCFIYLGSGTSKLQGARWWNGTALWDIVSNYTFTPMDVPIYHDFLVFICNHRWLWEMVMEGGVFFTVFLELSFGFLVWIPSLRWLMVALSILLHFGIGLIMGLSTFSMFMFCMVASFFPPGAFHYLLREARNLVFNPFQEEPES